ncbi:MULTISPECIES: o-succinylbenzoate synthase [unclassified Microbacterium]|uniref:o-succinylbenzoate synthase n=1 Tax=unclassified Microbacterium TaxID=2609290 RepID=UPI00214B1882|nr:MULTISPECIES: o-succinylbenzoate synthase [unclassified Microbacterium]MCR2784724.1 o-succinylbenzoate synthase [Microbacterium sp. zg.B96]MDL5352821.1 o-succinylbenzoate synthase [Microbacterium sp. zg-YB36]WIM16263.1 o-succinylbenzoate synthase [Microbacterium sp. zg-B96]
MRIDRLRLFQVGLPLVHGFETSSHRKTGLDHLLVEATDADGTVGWGEIASPADPFYGSETTETAWTIAVRYLVPAVLGSAWDTPAELEQVWAKIRGHEFAKAGFSIAAWDLHARASGQPLATALGGTRQSVAAGVSLGIEPGLDALLAQVDRQLAAGYGRVKLKIAPGWDVAPVRTVRAAYPDLDLHVDANGAYPDTAESVAVFRGLDSERLTMIEQPFAPRDFVAHARLQAQLATPLCLDESVVDLGDLRTMLALDAGRVLNIKVSRMGGLTLARRAHDVALNAGIPVWCGGMHEFGVGRAANVALSSLPGFTLPSDVSGSDKYYARDVIVPPVVARDGRVDVPRTPGLGHAVDTDWILENTSRHFDTAAIAA